MIQKCAAALINRNSAQQRPIGNWNRVTGASLADPGPPDVYVPVTGREKLLLRSKMSTPDTRCKMPAYVLSRFNFLEVSAGISRSVLVAMSKIYLNLTIFYSRF